MFFFFAGQVDLYIQDINPADQHYQPVSDIYPNFPFFYSLNMGVSKTDEGKVVDF